MIEEIEGNLLTLQEGILVQGCNCQGKMGTGFAEHVRAQWPTVYSAYMKVYHATGLRLGDVIAVAHPKWRGTAVARHIQAFAAELPENVIVANAMTQYRYSRDSGQHVDYDAISAAFSRVNMLARDAQMSVHFPLIGCGLAGGDWSEVAPRILAATAQGVPLTLWKKPTRGSTVVNQSSLF